MAVRSSALAPPEVTTVLIQSDLIDEFLDSALPHYQSLKVTREPNSCFAVLLGDVLDGAARVRSLRTGGNVRASDPSARVEYADRIIPAFGAAYEHPGRGFWMDPQDLLRISREADSLGLEILGSIHYHPDWHRISSSAAAVPLSEHPTPMDDHSFHNAGWPINLICYIESICESVYYTVRCWAPAPVEGEASPPIPLRIDLSTRSSARGGV
ncbi:hypothetical protein E1263_17450 [Kribbella antibiotica]|uniref:JAB domain-containing protein n=1 Tax=Kribbella antibiotica TaxID=190195 RepID=A0A4R4ZKY2_9ACTN|nr:hypothetical protein [Kribbella antibiotica]TDD58860.1 hypothetical protein E1263_17450 [Kribbella antibiotica]